MFERFVGMDIAKNWIDVYMDGRVQRIAQAAIESFVDQQSSRLKDALCVMESTGGYEYKAAHCLQAQGIAAHIAHPNTVKAFMRARGRLAKTDAIDARLLADFGAFLRPDDVRCGLSAEQQRLHTLGARLRQLKAMVQQERCRLAHPSMTEPFLHQTLKATLALLVGQIQAVEAEILRSVRSSPGPSRCFALLTSMNGVGLATALTFLAACPELGLLNRKQIAALIGVVPITCESGLRSGRASIRYGRADIRKVLSMAALVACRHNPVMRTFYERLCAKGKPKKVAIIAVARKMLIILNAMMRSGEPWRARESERALMSAGANSPLLITA